MLHRSIRSVENQHKLIYAPEEHYSHVSLNARLSIINTTMANTYTQIHIQSIMAVKFRKATIQPAWKERLQQYISGIVKNNGRKVLSVNSMPDHLHLFFGFRPNQSLSDLMKLVKGESSEWLNKQKFTPSIFRWQEGYGALSYARSQIKIVAEYIEKPGGTPS